jgi:16S rRNA (uracil1498-N3)-methyltransferase
MPDCLRVFLPELRAGETDVDPEATRYLARVHRLRPGDSFVAFDPRARLEATAVLLDTRRGRARVRLGAPRPAERISPLEVTLIQALGKGCKPDQVVRDATALGVSELLLVESSRTVVRLGSRGPGRRSRLETIAIEAARQSGRGDLPRITGPLPLQAALDRAQGRRIVLRPDADDSLEAALAGWDPGSPITLLIGPEGGLGSEELDRARACGFSAARFGPFVLRTETAATAALGVLVARLR